MSTRTATKETSLDGSTGLDHADGDGTVPESEPVTPPTNNLETVPSGGKRIPVTGSAPHRTACAKGTRHMTAKTRDAPGKTGQEKPDHGWEFHHVGRGFNEQHRRKPDQKD